MEHTLTYNQIQWLALLCAFRVESCKMTDNGFIEIIYSDEEGNRFKKGIHKHTWIAGYTTKLEAEK